LEERIQAVATAQSAAQAETARLAQQVAALQEQSQAAVTTQSDAAQNALLARHVAGLRERIHALEAQVKLSHQLLIADPKIPIPCNLQEGPALISVILPTYNRARAVIEAIESVRSQSLLRWDLSLMMEAQTARS
jgi:hypothetical protein